MPRSKRSRKIGVGQLSFTFGEPKDEAQETQDNGSTASPQPATARRQPERKRKWHSLIDKVYAHRNLLRAWGKVAANDGAPGIDGVSIQRFRKDADQRLQQLAEDLRTKQYRPQAVKRVFIPKSGGGERPLGIPTVRDRIVQQALLQVLEPIFEKKFSSRSHGFRPGLGCQTATHMVDAAVNTGYAWVVDADIQSFFDNVDHEILLKAINEEIADGSVLRLIRRILKAGVSLPNCSESEPTEIGTPQGGPVSPLLANIYLHAFDVQMKEAGHRVVRYADDFVIFARSESEARAGLEKAREILEGQLRLRLHPEKTRVVSEDEGFEFLGFRYFRHPRTGIRLKHVREKSAKNFRAAVKRRTPRLFVQSRPDLKNMTLGHLKTNHRIRAILIDVASYLDGWHGYFRTAKTFPNGDVFRRFDQYTRRRLRGVISGKIGGSWNYKIPNALLEGLGYVSLATRQLKYKLELAAASNRKV